MNSVSDICKSYFNGFQDMHCNKKCDGAKNTVGFLKILSYFTVILPLMFSFIYACSALVGRICPERNRKPIDQAIINLSKKAIGNKSIPNSTNPALIPQKSQVASKPNVVAPVAVKLEEYTDADLEEFFKSKHKCQKLFLIKGTKVGLVFDPSHQRINIGMTSCPSIVIAANVIVTPEIKKIVNSKAPNVAGVYEMQVQKYNGRPFFEALGFEGTYFDEAPARNFNNTFLTANPVFSEPAKPIIPKTGVDADLEEFFKSTQKCQKLFVVDGEAVAIAFDPSGNDLYLPSVYVKTSYGHMTTSRQKFGPIILLFDEKTTDKAKRNQIISRIQDTCSESHQRSFTQIDVEHGLITALGFEGGSSIQIAPTFTKAFLSAKSTP